MSPTTLCQKAPTRSRQTKTRPTSFSTPLTPATTKLKSLIKKWSSPGRNLYVVTARLTTSNMPEQMQAIVGSRKESPSLQSNVSENRIEMAGVRGRGKTIIEVGDRPAYLTGTCVDITERKTTEMLSESEARFETLVDTAPVMIWMSGGADKLCTWFNKPWLNFVGRAMEQELDNGWLQNVHADDVARCFETYNHAWE